jgi:RNA polymerase sigma-70 factor (ECF subfamily)
MLREVICSDVSADSHGQCDESDIDWHCVPRQGMPAVPDRMEPELSHGAARSAAIDSQARALLAHVAAGNQSAFEALYRLLSRRIYAFLFRMLKSAEAADEVMADTMYEVWKAAVRYRGDARVATWVLGIARNKALMAMRNRPRVRYEDIEDLADTLDSDAPDGYALLAQREARELIHRGLLGLSEKHRECLHLTHFEDLSMREIAGLLGIPEGTVKSRLSQARRRLAASVSVMMQRGLTPRSTVHPAQNRGNALAADARGLYHHA